MTKERDKKKRDKKKQKNKNKKNLGSLTAYFSFFIDLFFELKSGLKKQITGDLSSIFFFDKG